jgi:hypothetical protein
MQRIPSQYSYSPKSKLNGPTSRLTLPLRVVIPQVPVGISVGEWWPVSAEVDWVAVPYIDNKPNPSALVDEKALYYAVADRRIAGTAIDTGTSIQLFAALAERFVQHKPCAHRSVQR